MKEEVIKTNQKDITMRFSNYKAVGNLELKIPKGKNIYAIKGNNRRGKTSILDAIISVYNAKSKAETPLSDDSAEDNGNVYITGLPGSDDTTYTFDWRFDQKGKNKFQVINENTGEKVSSVTKIRELFNVSDLTAEEIFFKSQSAAGRREIIKLIKKVVENIDPDMHEKIEELESKIDPKNGELFLKRKDANSEVDSYKYQTPEGFDENIISKKDAIEKEYNNLLSKKEKYDEEVERSKDTLNKIEVVKTSIDNYSSTIMSHKSTLEEIDDDIEDIDQQIEELKKKRKEKEEKKDAINIEKNNQQTGLEEKKKELEELNKLINIESEWTDEDQRRIELGEKYIKTLNEELEKKEKYEKWEANKKKAVQDKIKAEKDLEDARKELANAYKNTDLPFNITIEDEEIYVNDMLIDESNQSRAEMKIIAALILIYHNNAPVIVMGQAHDFDAESFKVLNDILKKTGYIMFLDEVVRKKQEDIKVVGIDETNFETLE